MAAPVPTVERHPLDALPPALAEACRRISGIVWPAPDPVMLALREGSAPGEDRRAFRYIASLDGEPGATAITFERTIQPADGPALPVTALAGVCSLPAVRGKGLGRAVVRAAFAEIDAGRAPVSLFQTGVHGFYDKLGARPVGNAFVNSRFAADPARNPFWDTHVYIYPAFAPWPEGTIDLLGPAW
jgi:predicted N-acetyltransferase YhbS